MNDAVLSPKTKELLRSMTQKVLPDATYLAGGTAIALRLGHRISNDLDFFSSNKFIESVWEERLKTDIDLEITTRDWQTIIGVVGEVKFSLFYYSTPLIEKRDIFFNIFVASIQDLGAMKLDTITRRGTKRDLIDIYFIAKKYGLSTIISWYEQKFKNLSERILMIKKALVYFDDAEADEMPHMISPCSWNEVTKFFQKEVPLLK